MAHILGNAFRFAWRRLTEAKPPAANLVAMSYLVIGVVLTVASVQQARKGFAIAKQERDAWWKLVGEAPRRISVPSYGDQHYARHDPAGGEGIGVMELLVRTRTFIWLLNVQVERRPAAPKAQLLAELKKYAQKQQRRVGAG